MTIADAVRRRLTTAGDTIDQDMLRALADMGDERVGRYRLYDSFYDNTRRTNLTPLAKQWLEETGMPWGENFVEKVVDTHARALRIVGWEVQDNPQAAEWLSTTAWPAAQGPVLQSIVHTKTIGLGDGFLIADWNPARGLPTLRWNRPHIINPVYSDETGDLECASKVWATSARSATNPEGRLIMRMNVYYPDRIEKWFTLSSGDDSIWDRHRDTEDSGWPTWWTDDETEAGEPLGTNTIHFRRKPLGNTFGRAKIREAIPFQDELTKAILDQFEVMHEQGWQQRWATGVNGETDRIQVKPGEIVTMTNKDAKLGQFDAANPAPMGGVIKDIMTRMAAKTSTPLHDLISGDPPSGESLKTARMDLVAEGQDTIETFSDPWSRAGTMLLRLADVHSDLGFKFDPDAQVKPVWDDLEVRNEQDEATTLLAYAELGASNHTLLRRAGFDPDEEATLRAKEQPSAPPPAG